MSRRSGAIEHLGALIQRNTSLVAPAEVETSPMPFRDWELAVGSRIAARARPLKLERGVLHVQAASSTWAQELSMLGDVIIAQLRSRGLPVRSLRFRVGKVAPVERPPWREEVRSAPREAPLPPEVQRELGKVADPDLRDAIARAAARNLGWQEAVASVRPRSAAPSGTRAMPPTAAGLDAPVAAARTMRPAAGLDAPVAAARTMRPAAGLDAPVAAVGVARPAAAAPAALGDEAPDATSPRRAARDPRSVASRTARSDRTKAPSGAGPRGRS